MLDIAREGLSCHAASGPLGGSENGARRAPEFRHEALLYAGDAEFIGGTVPAILRAVALEQPVLVAVAPARIALLEEALGAPAAYVRFVDMHELGRNPARIISAWHEFLYQRARDGEPALCIGEPIWPGRTSSQIDECVRHEWLLNLAFAGSQPWRLVCPYDVDRLDDDVIEGALHNHPLTLVGSNHETSRSYRPGDWLARAFSGDLPAPSAAVEEIEFGCAQLKAVRSRVAAHAADARLSAKRAEQLVLAISELASNSVRYGGGGGRARVWREPGSLVCEVRDGGRIESPLSGRLSPRPNQLTGRGLWLVNQFCDLVQIRSDHTRTVVRVQMDLD
jgi:anti-sigma regulatory factor (Ser/Thr protein kinase)